MSDDRNVQGWVVMLVPLSFIDGTDEATGKPLTTAELHLRRAVAMNDANAAERTTFYQSLLKLLWLPPALRRVIMLELGLSLRKQRRDFEEGVTITMLHMIEERKQAMCAQQQRPRGGRHEAAIEETAHRQGMTVAALKKRVQRYKRRRKIRRQ